MFLFTNTKIPALFVVVFHVEICELGKFDPQSIATSINVLAIQILKDSLRKDKIRTELVALKRTVKLEM